MAGKHKSCDQVRQEFLDFFESRGHRFVPSSPLLPADDPTLLFANAGMNQFKDVFLGTEARDYTRAVNTQKCIRAGGKHNDLEDVGHDTYHHTFFEMLGNWSFGDYFKAEAIEWAWELLTAVWGLPKDRLHATVFEGSEPDGLEPDEESRRLWQQRTDIDPSHVHEGGKKDNFWEMGETGPCGPCSEIHIDLTPDGSGASLVNAGDPRVMEIWNLVFMEHNRAGDGTLTPLPAKHVDTGMGLERVCAVLQGKRSDYGTDLFTPIIRKIETLTEHRYGASSGLEDRFDVTGEQDIADVACRVVADHARALSFALADGVLPSNEGRGYVVRRILRRAARYGRQYLGIEGPFLVGLVPTVVELMGGTFPELRQRQEYVAGTIREEEESFGKTLDRGIDLFQREAEKLREAGQTVFSGDTAFELYATYGFPVDLTQIMATERGMRVDLGAFRQAMQRHREISAAGESFRGEEIPSLPATDDSAKYDRREIEAAVVGWVRDGRFIDQGALEAGQDAPVVLDRTNFYGEAGGQVGDTGELAWEGGRFVVTDTQRAGDSVLHVGRVEQGRLEPGRRVTCRVDPSRMDTRRNHTATHLLNWALRRVLGDHVNQAGSVVDPERLRFDFTHHQALSEDELVEAEGLVNERVLADEPVGAELMPLEQARRIPGVRAVFGEKYPDPVRVVTMGGRPELTEPDAARAAELCGGTHLWRTGQVGLFKIVSEESAAKGIRRITAVTGRGAAQWARQSDRTLKEVSRLLRASPGDLTERIRSMQQEIKQLRKKPVGGKAPEMQTTESLDTAAGKVLIAKVPGADAATMRGICDRQRQKGAAAVMLASSGDGKVTLVAMVKDELAREGRIQAGDWVRAVAPLVGGGGGGKPTLAQAGGKQPEKLDEALQAALQWVRQRIG